MKRHELTNTAHAGQPTCESPVRSTEHAINGRSNHEGGDMSRERSEVDSRERNGRVHECLAEEGDSWYFHREDKPHGRRMTRQQASHNPSGTDILPAD